MEAEQDADTFIIIIYSVFLSSVSFICCITVHAASFCLLVHVSIAWFVLVIPGINHLCSMTVIFTVIYSVNVLLPCLSLEEW